MNEESIQAWADRVLEQHPNGPLPPLKPTISQLAGTSDHPHLLADSLMEVEAIAETVDTTTSDEAARAILADTDSMRKTPSDDFKVAYRGLAQHLHDSTVAYFKTHRRLHREVASGTAVEIEGRVFVATCSHTLPNDAARLQFVSKQEHDLGECHSSILGVARTPEGSRQVPRPDVGVVELAPNFVSERLSATPIPLERILPVGPGKERCMTYVAGFPRGAIDQQSVPGGILLSFACHLWAQPPVPIRFWSRVPRSKQLDSSPHAEIDVFLPYDGQRRSVRDLNRHAAQTLYKPHGLSGGGFWQPIIHDQPLWTPDNYGLIAIQSLWPQQGRFLQATQIVHWLNLVASHNPELSETISGHIGRCRETQGKLTH